MNNFEIHRLFPTCVMMTSLDRDFTDEENKALHDISDFRDGITNFVSDNKFVLNDPRLEKIKSVCTQAANTYVQEIMRPVNSVEVYITQSWINVTPKGNSHHRHWHANSFISGVLYINVVAGKDRIYFHNPKNKETINFHTIDFTHDNSPVWYLNVKFGDIILFPSSLEHHVETNKEDHKRVSLAFNTFVKGTIGLESGSAYLKL